MLEPFREEGLFHHRAAVILWMPAFRGSVAQLVERTTENREVTGSTPVGATSKNPMINWEIPTFEPLNTLLPGAR